MRTTDNLARALRATLPFLDSLHKQTRNAPTAFAAMDARAALADYDTNPQPHPATVYAAYCEQRRDAAAGPHDREFWHRQRGAALKAATL